MEPDTLLLDEPLSNLDANLREEMRFEVRRLHDAYRYTTIYVTHDQSEAMTTADLIAVMNAGRIEQLGTPQQVYEEPRSEFTASFLGGSNILRGKALDATHMTFAGKTIECCGAPMVRGRGCGRVGAPARGGSSRRGSAACPPMRVQGTVVRNVFLGNTRDYIVEVADGTQLRVTAAPGRTSRPARPVWLLLPPGRCRALVG